MCMQVSFCNSKASSIISHLQWVVCVSRAACMVTFAALQACDDMKLKHAAELRDTLALIRHEEHVRDVLSSAELVREREQ